MEPKFNLKELKIHSKLINNKNVECNEYATEPIEKERVNLTTHNAVKYLLEGTLRLRVCRYCLNVTDVLSELDEVLVIAINGCLHEVTIRDMVASFHPFKVNEDKNFPNKICESCLNQTIECYLFVQKCEQSERALRNCFNDMYNKLEKLDPIEPIRKRGKRKLNPNHNILYTEHRNVMDYAEPIINIVNVNTIPVNKKEISDLECQKCWNVLPNLESLLNHEKSHPDSMWFSCKICGKSFVKRCHLKKHLKENHLKVDEINNDTEIFKCNECGSINETLGEHLHHTEKHKFKITLDSLIKRKAEDLCSVCVEKGTKMIDLNEVINLHGGYPNLMGKRTVQDILNETIPGMPLDSYLGTKICDICLNHTITTFVFLVKIQYIRNRLNTCVTLMLKQLDNVDLDVKNDSTVMVQISQDTILPYNRVDSIDEILADEVDECKTEVLEDEFRESESSDESESESDESDYLFRKNDKSSDENDDLLENPARNATRTYMKRKLVNGYQSKYDDFDETLIDNICSEFLTFKKRKTVRRVPCKYTCPFCNKHFISDYFVKKHILKHISTQVQCNICFKPLKSKFHLFEHNKMVHVLKNYDFVTCKTCGRTFSDSNKLKRHERCHSTKFCVICEKKFVSQYHYNVHMQRHAVKFSIYANKNEQTCSFCEKACSNENELSLHVNKTHLQIKPYNCDMCEKLFYTEYNLCSHKKLHSLYSKESCIFCNKVLKCRKDLVIHIRKHMGSKPHRCPVCRESFYSEAKMKKHMKSTHGGIYCCRLCRMIMSSQQDLRDHINVVHSSM